MKKIFFICLAIVVTTTVTAQKNTVPALPDINKLKNMNPAELEAYKKQMMNQLSKQAKTIAAKNNIKINEVALPDFELKLPVKDIKRLSLLPIQPPTLIQLADGLRQTKKTTGVSYAQSNTGRSKNDNGTGDACRNAKLICWRVLQ